MDCIFCSIIAGESPSHKIYEDENVFAFLNIKSVSKGHTLIIPKVHATNLESGTGESARYVMDAVYKLAPFIMKGVGAQGYNLGMNHGECAGQIVPHTHVHVMPRFEGTPRTFVKTHPSNEELAAIAKAIREAILG